MKKILICLVLAIILTNCEIGPRKANAEGRYSNNYGNTYDYTEQVKDGMTYGIWYVQTNSSQTGYDIEAVNLTKERLEVQLLELQITQIKRR